MDVGDGSCGAAEMRSPCHDGAGGGGGGRGGGESSATTTALPPRPRPRCAIVPPAPAVATEPGRRSAGSRAPAAEVNSPRRGVVGIGSGSGRRPDGSTMAAEPSARCAIAPIETIRPSPSRTATKTNRRRMRTRPSRLGGGATAVLAVAALLLSSKTASAEVPDGLLFASELYPDSPAFSSLRGPTSAKGTIYSKTMPERERRHPVHRIYRDNAHVRRRVEELENSLPYFQTGIRGDPDHRLEYRNHPYDLLRREREARELAGAGGGSFKMDEGEEPGANGEGDGARRLQNDPSVAPQSNGDAAGSPDDDPFRPIRIHFDTAALDAELTARNGPQIEFVKNVILPRMRDYWSSALSVVPVEGNLLVSTSELQGRAYCGDTEFSRVPPEHISTGVPNSDLVLYVSGAPSARFCGPSTLAVAVACNFDQFDRPTAGAINFCLDQIDLDEEGKASESVTDDNVDVAVHEAAHVLGMSSNSYRFFWDPTSGMERTARPFSLKTVVCVDGVERELILPSDNTMKFFIATSGQRYASIITPRVAAVARNQFDCQELNGAQLENQPTGENSCTGDHWDERMYYPESLSGVISPTTNVLSPLTLALLEDSGWYRANYTKAHVSPWGHGVGCDFVSSPCLVGGGNGRDGSLPSYAKGYFCNKASSRGCDPHHTHKMACTVIDYSLRGEYEPPVQFQYFEDSAVGGPREADYCPVYGSVYSGLKPADLDCRIAANGDSIDVIYSEEYGENSMCFETTSGEGRCYSARCVYEDFNLRLQVDGKWYTCEEDFQQIEVSTLSGAFGTTVTCPRLSSVCPDMFCPGNCAGRGRCVFDHANGTDSAPRPKCECFDETDTSAGCSETFVLDGKYLRDGTSLKDNLKKNFFEPLIAVFVDHPDTWTTASWAWAAALFVVFLLMILCICSSFWPEKEKPKKSAIARYAV